MVNKTRRKTLGPVTANRRMTMGPTNTNDAGSGPSKKRPSKQRMSMAPRMNGSDSILQSTNTNTNTNTNKPTTPSRRKSLGGDLLRQTTTTTTAAPATTIRSDPRPISDKAFLNSCIRKLMQYLVNSDYQHPVKLKDLSRPSAKDFNNIVTFLLRRVDPTFNDDKSTLKFEDEVALAFKALGYPFNISKTALVAAGSPHTWPSLLLALTWLIELLQCTEHENDHDHDDHDPNETEATMDLEHLEAKTDKAFLKYTEEAYLSFLAGDDEHYDQLEENLVEYFEKDNMAIEHEIERITDVNAAIVESIETLAQKGHDLPEQQKRLEDLATDLEKFHELVRQLNEHKNALATKVHERTTDLAQKDKQLQTMTQTVQQLKHVVNTQELSMKDVKRLQDEGERLKSSIRNVAATKQEYNKTAWRNEMELETKMEELKRMVELYNAIWNDLDYSAIDDDNEAKYKVVLRKEAAHEDPIPLLGGVDLPGHVTPLLLSMKNDLSQKTVQLRRNILKLMDRQEETEEQLNEGRDNVEIVKGKIRRANDTLQQEKEEQDNSISKRQEQLKSLEEKTEALRDPAALEAAIAKYQKEYSELETVRQTKNDENAILKQEMLQEFNDAVQFCAEHKQYQEKTLRELKEYIQNAQKYEVILLPSYEELLQSL